MATRTADIHIRINPLLKKQAEEYFDGEGVTMSQALEQFLSWTVAHHKTPMRLTRRANIPNEKTMTKAEVRAMLDEALAEVNDGKYVTLETMKAGVEDRYGIKLRV
ncbi:type II toxin-antitoxin system RelB/DinJ family antitoxin [Candidatus Saccharibacteria bacterium]|nr:type II toxin-antitoxin system RelB/DinJ family antitoxin [Candidatus Saccharibacteria bacterium]